MKRTTKSTKETDLAGITKGVIHLLVELPRKLFCRKGNLSKSLVAEAYLNELIALVNTQNEINLRMKTVRADSYFGELSNREFIRIPKIINRANFLAENDMVYGVVGFKVEEGEVFKYSSINRRTIGIYPHVLVKERLFTLYFPLSYLARVPILEDLFGPIKRIETHEFGFMIYREENIHPEKNECLVMS